MSDKTRDEVMIEKAKVFYRDYDPEEGFSTDGVMAAFAQQQAEPYIAALRDLVDLYEHTMTQFATDASLYEKDGFTGQDLAKIRLQTEKGNVLTAAKALINTEDKTDVE